MAGYGNNGLIREQEKNNKTYFYVGAFFVVTLVLLGVLIILFVLSSLNQL